MVVVVCVVVLFWCVCVVVVVVVMVVVRFVCVCVCVCVCSLIESCPTLSVVNSFPYSKIKSRVVFTANPKINARVTPNDLC